MPQTREHMEICTLLGVRHGLVVLTKVDLVDEEMLELAQEDVKEFTRGTFLENAPIIPVSAVTGQGVPDFIQTLDALSRQIPDRPPSTLFRLPVDRVFTMKGFGTVITGTLVSGKVQVGDAIMLYPSGVTSKCAASRFTTRVSTRPRPACARPSTPGAGQGVGRPGEVLSSPSALKSSYMVDVQFHYLASAGKPLKNRSRVRFHTGTTEILGNLILLEHDQLKPGETAVAQLRLDAPVAIVKGDHYVVRSYSPVRTIGGGQVLNPIPPKHKRFQPAIVQGLKGILSSGPEGLIAFHIEAAGYAGASWTDLRLMTNLTDKQLRIRLAGHDDGTGRRPGGQEARTFIHKKSFDRLVQGDSRAPKGLPQGLPLKSGMLKEELKASSTRHGRKALQPGPQPDDQGRCHRQEEKTVRLKAHKVSLAGDEAIARQKMLKIYKDSPAAAVFPGRDRDFESRPDPSQDVLNLLIEEGLIVRTRMISTSTPRHRGPPEARGEISRAERRDEPLQFKDMAGGASRKFLIPLLEYFDSKNVTLRVGDVRKLRRG
jgi:selenocysteine-specific elongation factor